MPQSLKPHWNPPIASVLALVCAVLFGCNEPSVGEQEDGASNPTTVSNNKIVEAPASIELTLATVEEIKQQIANSKGKITVVDFWSTSCIPCMQEYPELVALAEAYPDQVRCISVNVDYLGLKKKPVESYRDKAMQFLSKVKSVQVLNLQASETDETVSQAFDYSAIPNVMVYGKDAKLLKQFNDANSEGGASYQRDINPFIEKQIADATIVIDAS